MTTTASTSKTTFLTTSSATPSEARTTRRLTFRSPGENFTSDLLDTSSTAFTERAELLKSELQPLYQRQSSSFRSLTVISFSNGSIINNIDLEFELTSVPNNTEIENVLIRAAPNITAFNIDNDSVDVQPTATTDAPTTKTAISTTITTSSTTTTAAPTTIVATTTTTADPVITSSGTSTAMASQTTTMEPPTTEHSSPTTSAALEPTAVSLTTLITATTTEAPPPKFVVQAVFVEPFVEELKNKTSKLFKSLELKITTMYDVIYKAEFGLLFIRSFVIEFRPAAGRTRMENTEAEMGLEFNKTTPIAEIPAQKAVQEVLIEAVNTSTAKFNLTIERESITITGK
ncbi:uncharacterized protein [Leuresthes tenuis]|uniref:uncharacterized protein isoform X1 n=1 Tax=Leuresthes tenuis TaxID=355514 RepID=UPI003B5088F8